MYLWRIVINNVLHPVWILGHACEHFRWFLVEGGNLHEDSHVDNF